MGMFTKTSLLERLSDEERKKHKEVIETQEKEVDLWNKKVRSISLSLGFFLGAFSFFFLTIIVPHKKDVKQTLSATYHILEAIFVKKSLGDSITEIGKYFNLDDSPVSGPSVKKVLSKDQLYRLAIEEKIKEKLAVLNEGQSVQSTADDIPFYWYSPRPGNSVERISKKHGMFPDELIRLNLILQNDPDHIEYGHHKKYRIKVRAWDVYRMKIGDSFKGISRRFGVRPNDLAKANPTLRWRVRFGRIIIIPCPIGQ